MLVSSRIEQDASDEKARQDEKQVDANPAELGDEVGPFVHKIIAQHEVAQQYEHYSNAPHTIQGRDMTAKIYLIRMLRFHGLSNHLYPRTVAQV